MSCARPLIRVYNPNDHNITGSIMTLETYRERAHNPTATYESLAYRTDVMLLPCGKCLGCRLRQRQDWETRMLMESKTLTPVWFLTLTWNQEYVPGMVRKTGEIIRGAVHQWTTGDAPEVVQILLQEDMVRFNKRLRKKQETSDKWGLDLRYFYCGEYGENTGRPHHHGIYYGLEIPDLKKKRGDNPYFESEEINKIWGMGNVIIAEASPETMAYVAGYVTKKTYGNDSKRYRELGLTPPYCCMSRNPGLGYDYYTSHKEQMYADDGLYFNGKKRPIPRYFDKKYESERPKELWETKRKRQESAINALKLKMSNTGLTIEQEAKVEEETKRQRFRKARGLL